MVNKTLHLFTAQFPFGNKSETFLETEVKFLSQGFHKVVIYPSFKVEGLRSIPENCEVNELFWSPPLTKGQKIHFLLRYLFSATQILNNERKDKGLKTFWNGRKVFLDILVQQLQKFELLKKHKLLNDDDVYYDYWYIDSTLALALAKKKGLLSFFYARAHSFDLYDERWPTTGVPFRNYVYSMITNVFFISKMGMRYFFAKLPGADNRKAMVSYLGVQRQNHISPTKKNAFTLVSCSSIVEHKNVQSIPELLNSQSHSVNWFHLGDGPLKEVLLNETAKLKKHISFTHLGHLANRDVLEFYRNNAINGFISLSLVEGLPVSMMEAMSFGVPILTKNVGAISELITNETGMLIEENDNPVEVLEQFLTKKWNPERIQEFQCKYFDGEENYRNFTKVLCGEK